jgi:hypothetical protein
MVVFLNQRRAVRRFKKLNGGAFSKQCKEIKEMYTKTQWDNFSAETQFTLRSSLETTTIDKDKENKTPRQKKKKRKARATVPLINYNLGELNEKDQEDERGPPGRPKGEKNFTGDVTPDFLWEVNKNSKQAKAVFYSRAAALKDKCNRNGQKEPDTVVVTMVIQRGQSAVAQRKPNSSLLTPQQARVPPTDKPRQVTVTSSCSDKNATMAAVSEVMLLMTEWYRKRCWYRLQLAHTQILVSSKQKQCRTRPKMATK